VPELRLISVASSKSKKNQRSERAGGRVHPPQSPLYKHVMAALRAAMSELVARADPRSHPPRQAEAARKSGIAQSKISEILNQGREPRLDTLLLMKEFLGFKSWDSLLGLKATSDAQTAEEDIATWSESKKLRYFRLLYQQLAPDIQDLDGALAVTRPILPSKLEPTSGDKRSPSRTKRRRHETKPTR
jgi:transcriptional regulator with XRE-family HTH domain